MSSSLRNQRVIVASLFLPTTAVIGTDSPPETPIPTFRIKSPSSLEAAFKDGAAKSKGPTPPRPQTLLERRATAAVPTVGPPKSIIDDLKDKSRNVTPTATPGLEARNPFTQLSRLDSSVNIRLDTAAKSSSPRSPPARKGSQYNEFPNTRRVQRKHSRSSSRRSDREPLVMPESGGFHQPWHFEVNAHCNGGLRNALESVDDKLRHQLWVGTLGTQTDGFSESLRADIDSRMIKQCHSLPVWIPDAEFESCYDEFCHQVLWPCLHYAVPDAPKTKLFYESASFKQYKAVNQRFADVIIDNYQDGDIIWVNDYHLMLLPAILRASPRLPQHAIIGYFHHVAFPSSEIFRCLTVRESLLRGLLGADLVGFQTANNARHFRQTVSRILSLEALPKGIQIDGNEGGRFVDVGVFPMGIDVKDLTMRKRQPEVLDWVKALRQRYSGMKIVVGRDKLDGIQGVRQKIQAFEAFLDKHPEYQEKVVLIQIALQTTESNEEQGGVADVVSRINSRFSTLTYQPVVFLHTQDITFSQYLALLTVADAFLVTSLREGMALRTHEFVECQEDRHRPLILSEFTGSYSYSGFRSCIAINPWDIRGTGNAIHEALTMSDDEAKSRWEDLHSHVITQTAQAFVTSFLTRCIRAGLEHIHPNLSTIPSLSTARHLLPRYKHSRKRLLLLDLEGTLVPRRISSHMTPSPELLQLLTKITQDDKNEVWILSGLPVKGVLDSLAKEVPKIGIVAENGCFIRTPPTRNFPSVWVNTVSNFNFAWKQSCLEILQYFTERTPGSSIEEREASIVWRFWNGSIGDDSSDFKWARRQAAEAQNHIFDSLGERYGLRIRPGNSSFLVLPNNVSRSTAVGAIMHPGGPARTTPRLGYDAATYGDGDGVEDNHDFVLAVSSDEKLLGRLNELDHSETCSTSGKGTDAKWKLEAGSDEVIKVLGMFASAA